METNPIDTSFETYSVSSIRIPEDLGVARELHQRNLKLSSREREGKFDYRTVFYDVFYQPEKKNFFGIGPKWLNLKNALLPMEIRCGREVLNYKLTEFKLFCMLEIDAPQDVSHPTTSLIFQFPGFSTELEIDTSLDGVSRINDPNLKLSITNLQKNNYIEWIEDWVKWHWRLHNVQRLILYDNGSSNREELEHRLRDLDVGMKVVLVDWPFEYGRSPDKFAQRGSMNHCRLRFSVPNGYCIQADIDEYLVNKTGRPIVDYLDASMAEKSIGSVRMRESWIPRQEPIDKASSDVARIWEQSYRRHDQGIQATGKTKYIYQFDRIKYNSVHIAVRLASESSKLRFTWLDHLVYAISNSRFFTKNLIGLNHHPKKTLGIHYVPPSGIFYYHFRGLRRQPTEADDPTKEKFDPKQHVVESEVRDLCFEAGLVSPKEGKAQ